MNQTDVVITGMGVVSALGHDVETLWQACLKGETRVEPTPPAWDAYYKAKSRVWSPLELPNYRDFGLSRADELRYDRTVLNAIVASEEALTRAGLSKSPRDERGRTYQLDGIDGDRCGIFMGSGLGCISSAFNNYVPHLLGANKDDLFEQANVAAGGVEELAENLAGLPRVNPFASVQSMSNAIGAMLSIRYGCRGATETLIYACAAGTASIARAYRAIQNGEIDIAIVGGSEYYGDRAGGVFMAFDRLQTLVNECEPIDWGNRPFDSQRSGFLFSQGAAGIVILESARHAEARGATALAAVKGMSITSDANSLAAISEDDNAIELMFEKLFVDAKVDAAQIDYVNAHGTSTPQNDPIEAAILKKTFPGEPFVNSTKSLLGHTIGASGTIECIISILSMRDGKVHPSRNLDDPVADLNFATTAREADIQYAVTHSFGFGGHNVGLVLEKI